METRIPQSRAEVHEVYSHERDVHQSEFVRLSALDRKYSNWRLLVFGLVLLTAAVAIPSMEGAPALLLIPLALTAVFIRLLVSHDRVINDMARAKGLFDYFEAGLARIEDRWTGKGDPGLRYEDSHHPYAVDLDLFGAGSLFELVCAARTRMGQDCLAEWFKSPADRVVVELRQAAVQELAANSELRWALATEGGTLHNRISAATVINWGEAPIRLKGDLPLRITAVVLSAGAIVAAIPWIAGVSGIPFYLLFLSSQAVAASRLRKVTAALRGINEPVGDLVRLSELMALVEDGAYESPVLNRIRSALASGGLPVSARIARLRVLQGRLDARRNVAIAPFAAILLLTFHLAYAIERWRDENGVLIAQWLDALAEIEALCSLATYAYENPQDTWPELDTDRLILEARAIGHPLLPLDRMVRNDVALSSDTRLLIISGSNMSGKSTLLRSLGVNVVLAFAGGPVRADLLVVSPLQLGASIRTLDSLQEGVSRFYAEISRLRQILDIARDSPPCLFLLDEILHGTNSHDRRIGAEAIARALIDADAIGLLTTHDLAISQIAETEKRSRNVHFEDHMSDGKMAFDYKLRDGVVTKSNAIELMRSVGLPV